MRKQLFFITIFLIAVYFLAGCQIPSDRGFDNRPKGVILILVDDIGYGDIDILHPSSLETPNIDTFYTESLRLTDFHTGTTCSPTRASLMTGRDANATNAWHTISGREVLRQNEQTMAEVFQENGWRTGIIGKWHLGDGYPFSPRFRGFDHSLIHGSGGVSQSGDYWGNDYYSDVDSLGRPTNPDVFFDAGEEFEATEFVTDFWFSKSFQFIDGAIDEKKPFFLYLPTNAAHRPFNAPAGGKEGFDGLVENLDLNMGRLDEYLKARGIKDDVLVIFTSDNGTTYRRDGGLRGRKASFYDGGHNVPFFIRWKNGRVGGTPAKSRDVSGLTMVQDLLPTFIEWFGLRKPSGGQPIHGTSVATMLADRSYTHTSRLAVVDTQRSAQLERWKRASVMFDDVKDGVVEHKWRLVRRSERAEYELYDFGQDRRQANDIADDHPEIVAELSAAYEDWWERVSKTSGPYPPIVVDTTREQEHYLSPHGWIGSSNSGVWSQQQVKSGRQGSSVHSVRFDESGRYRFELRRWPREDGGSIDGPSAQGGDNKIFPITRARLSIEGIGQAEADVSPGSAQVAVEMEINAGAPTELKAEFLGADGTALVGAYFIYITKVSEQTFAAHFFERPNRGGMKWSVSEGIYKRSDLERSAVGNDAISSLHLAPGYNAFLCQHARFGGSGSCREFQHSSAHLGELDDRVSYIEVRNSSER